MGVPEPLCRVGRMSPGVLSPPQGQAVPCLTASSCQLCWCPADNPGTAVLVQGAVIPAPPPAGISARLVSTRLLLPSAGSSAALSTTSWPKLAGLTRGQQRTSRRPS